MQVVRQVRQSTREYVRTGSDQQLTVVESHHSDFELEPQSILVRNCQTHLCALQVYYRIMAIEMYMRELQAQHVDHKHNTGKRTEQALYVVYDDTTQV